MIVTVVAAVIALISGVGALRNHGDLNRFLCEGDCGPRYVAAPAGLTADAFPGSAQGVTPLTAGEADAAAVERAVREAMDSDDLGEHTALLVVDVATGTDVVARGADDPLVPASTTKLLTGFAALATLDPQRRLTTRVVGDGDSVVLVGGGDPALVTEPPKRPQFGVSADLDTLAAETAAALKEAGTTSVSLGYDASLFAGPSASPSWPGTYLSQDIVTPIVALWVERGVHGRRDDDPARTAAGRFAERLGAHGITVRGEPRPAKASSGARELASAAGPTVAQVVEHLVTTSDNEAAEALLRHIAIAAGEPPTFDGGVAAVTEALQAADIPTDGLRLHDGSGLSRDNRISPRTLVETVLAALASPRTAPLASSLPVGGFNGSLNSRFGRLPAAWGVVRAKTGTLTGVHSLAGLVTTRDGRTLAFAVMADDTEDVNPFVTQAALDAVVAALADCDCGR